VGILIPFFTGPSLFGWTNSTCNCKLLVELDSVRVFMKFMRFITPKHPHDGRSAKADSVLLLIGLLAASSIRRKDEKCNHNCTKNSLLADDGDVMMRRRSETKVTRSQKNTTANEQSRNKIPSRVLLIPEMKLRNEIQIHTNERGLIRNI
jgi:hypothetical protein